MSSFGCVAEHYRDTILPCSGQWEVQRPVESRAFRLLQRVDPRAFLWGKLVQNRRAFGTNFEKSDQKVLYDMISYRTWKVLYTDMIASVVYRFIFFERPCSQFAPQQRRDVHSLIKRKIVECFETNTTR